MILRQAVDLQPSNTLALPGRAALYSRIESPAQLADPLAAKTPRFILGGGSNLVLTGDFDGLMLHMAIPGKRLVKEDADVEIRGRVTRQKVIFMAGPAAPEKAMSQLLKDLRDMSMFTKTESADEIRAKLNAINPLASLQKTSSRAAPPRNFRNAAQEIEDGADAQSTGISDDDIPF